MGDNKEDNRSLYYSSDIQPSPVSLSGTEELYPGSGRQDQEYDE